MKHPTETIVPTIGLLSMLCLLAPASLIAGSSNLPDEVTVRPGETVICPAEHCTVYFETPTGSGTHNVLQDGSIKAGVAVGGQRVLLGGYSDESLVFRVEGTDLPPAYLTVIGGP